MSSRKKVIAAMSGGVDSSVSAYLLLQSGFDVLGVTLDMKRKGDRESAEDARRVAAKLGIEHQTIDAEDNYREKVLEYFKNSYLRGETPNPCVMCNRFIKFKFLLDLMGEIGADYIATGHYAKIAEIDGKFKLFRAANIKKDQSYFLSYLKEEYLPHIKFPLGDIKTKDETRKIALDIGLHNALKHDSQDICFIETDYKDFLNKNNARGKRGLIKHINGKILGEHGGIVNYTIGQRKGLGIASERPLYVAKIDAENNTVYVGDDRDLFSKSFKIKALSALGDIADGGRYVFKLRSTHAGQEGRINLKDCSVVLDEESRAITAGQLCAIYDGAQVVGGGWISGVEAKRE